MLRVLALLLSVVLALSGCGGGDSSGGGSARDALTGLKPISSAFVDAVLRVDVKNPPPSVGGPIELRLSGPLRSNGRSRIPSLDWRIAFAGFGQRFESRAVSTGTNAYVQLGGEDFEVGEQAVARTNQNLAQTQAKAPRGLASIGIDPLGAVEEVKEAGKVTVGGASTTRYTGRLGLDKLLDQIDQFLKRVPQLQGTTVGGLTVPQTSLTPDRRNKIKTTFRDPTFEADVGSDRTLRGLRLTVPFVTPPDRQQAAGGITGGTISYRLTYSDVGGDQTITPPAKAAPLKDFIRELNKLIARRG